MKITKLSFTSNILAVLTVISLIGIYFTSVDESLKSIFFPVFLALLVSVIFYVSTVAIPERQRRNRVKRMLSKQYYSFKIRCINLMLMATLSQSYPNKENLLNHEEFARYFKCRVNEEQIRWDLVTTSIDDQDYVFHGLLAELEFLIREVDHARSSIAIENEKVESFMIRLSEITYLMKMSQPSTDDYKYFSRNIWQMFSRFDPISGQTNEDLIEEMIQAI